MIKLKWEHDQIMLSQLGEVVLDKPTDYEWLSRMIANCGVEFYNCCHWYDFFVGNRP